MAQSIIPPPKPSPVRHLYPVPTHTIRDEERGVYNAGGLTVSPASPPAPAFTDDEVVAACGFGPLGLVRLLEERADAGGSTFATVSDLAIEGKCSTRHIRAMIATLEEHGFLRRETVHGRNGICIGVRFRILRYPCTNYPEVTPEVTPEASCASARRPVLGSLRSNERNSPDEEKNDESTPPTPQRGEPAVASAKQRATTWPMNFTLTDDLRAVALKAGIRPDRVDVVWEGFRDKAAAKGYRYVDWAAAWRAWVRSPYQDGDRSGATNGHRPAPPPVVERGKVEADGGLARWKAAGRRQ